MHGAVPRDAELLPVPTLAFSNLYSIEEIHITIGITAGPVQQRLKYVRRFHHCTEFQKSPPGVSATVRERPKARRHLRSRHGLALGGLAGFAARLVRLPIGLLAGAVAVPGNPAARASFERGPVAPGAAVVARDDGKNLSPAGTIFQTLHYRVPLTLNRYHVVLPAVLALRWHGLHESDRIH